MKKFMLLLILSIFLVSCKSAYQLEKDLRQTQFKKAREAALNTRKRHRQLFQPFITPKVKAQMLRAFMRVSKLQWVAGFQNFKKKRNRFAFIAYRGTAIVYFESKRLAEFYVHIGSDMPLFLSLMGNAIAYGKFKGVKPFEMEDGSIRMIPTYEAETFVIRHGANTYRDRDMVELFFLKTRKVKI